MGKRVKTKAIFSKLTRACSRKNTLAKPLDQRAIALDDSQSTSDAVASDEGRHISTSSTDGDDVSVSSQKSGTSASSGPNPLLLKERIMETLISNLFTTGTSLETAYAQLHSALEPYDRETLRRADQEIISELKNFSEYKRFYEERLADISSEQNNLAAQPEIRKKETLLKSYEGIIGNFHTQIRSRGAEVEKLRDMLAVTTLEKEKVQRRCQKLEQKTARGLATNVSNATVDNFNELESALLSASETVKSFTKVIVTLMKLAEWDLEAAAKSIHPGVPCVHKKQRKRIFESYVWYRMLNGFENESFNIDGCISSILEPVKHRQECYQEFQDLRTADVEEVISAHPDGLFAKFAFKKFLELIHPQMEESFFGNLEHRKHILNGKHPRSQFYINFLKLAKATWLVHRMAFSFEPRATIFQAKCNSEFSPLHMKSVPEDSKSDHQNFPGGIPKVGFTVIPGFRVENAVIKCQVYLTPLIEN